MATSLVTSCPRCASALVEIRLDQAGQEMVMRSCSTCDTRWWSRDGEDVALGSVLHAMASAKRVATSKAGTKAGAKRTGNQQPADGEHGGGRTKATGPASRRSR